MLSRREMVEKLAAGTAAAVAMLKVGSVKAATGGASAPAEQAADRPWVVDSGIPATATATPPWQLLAPLAPGSPVGNGWHVASLSGVVDGSCVLTLENERGRSRRIHICRNDGKPRGLLHTDKLDLVVMNGGQGDLPTEESLGRAVAEVAHVLAKNERLCAVEQMALLSHEERVRQFSGPADRRLR